MDRHPEDDSTLVRRCLAGDGQAWQVFVDTHRRGMIALGRRILPLQDAEDVVDAVLADLWQRGRLSSFQARSSLRTWLGAVVINTALNARRAAATRAANAVAAAPIESARADPPSDQLQAVLRDAIAALAPARRTLVLLYYEQDLSLEAIGGLLGCSKSTVSRELRDARAEIRRSADRMARDRWGSSLESLREGVDLARLDLDLRASCAPSGNKTGPGVSKLRSSS
ncbi:MAG: RNA polymerase sigma factor [Vicinamibacterales bacterium]